MPCHYSSNFKMRINAFSICIISYNLRSSSFSKGEVTIAIIGGNYSTSKTLKSENLLYNNHSCPTYPTFSLLLVLLFVPIMTRGPFILWNFTVHQEGLYLLVHSDPSLNRFDTMVPSLALSDFPNFSPWLIASFLLFYLLILDKNLKIRKTFKCILSNHD